MDIKVSNKEEMYQPKGAVDIIVGGIFDFFLIEEPVDESQRYPLDLNNDQKWIYDVEIIDEVLEETKDRVVFSVTRQRGQDPMNPNEGIQWTEAMMNEIPVPLLMQQIADAAAKESSYVNVSFETITVNGSEQLAVRFNTTDVSKYLAEASNG